MAYLIGAGRAITLLGKVIIYTLSLAEGALKEIIDPLRSRINHTNNTFE